MCIDNVELYYRAFIDKEPVYENEINVKDLYIVRTLNTYISLLIITTLSGCTLPELTWHETNWDGILVEGNQRPKLVYKQDLAWPGIGPNGGFIAAVDHQNRKYLIDKDISKVIDDYLPKITPLSPWVLQTIDGKKESEYIVMRNRGPVPYKLYLLTISPIVVLAVPIEVNFKDRFCGGFREGCLQSDALPYRSYDFKEEPMVRSGSFWFSPELREGFQYIPVDATNYLIKVKDSAIELTTHNGIWSVRRNIKIKQSNEK